MAGGDSRLQPDGLLCRYGSRHCAALGAPAEALAGLNGIDYGAWQGLTREEAAARWPAEVEIWYWAPHLAVIPQGECR
jgi:probable phosphoglycerate mutase